jgi:hypothetical protein
MRHVTAMHTASENVKSLRGGFNAENTIRPMHVTRIIMKPRNFHNTEQINPEVRQFIDSERDNFYSNYDLPPCEIERAEKMFADLEALGRKYHTKEAFFEAFRKRTISQEYYRTMLGFAIYVRPPESKPKRAGPGNDAPSKTKQ